MKIHNIRLGHATNSSSTHSVVYLSEPASDDDVEDGDFGWNFFTAASVDAKERYLALTLDTALRGMVSQDMANAIIKDWVPNKSVINELAKGELKGYIDHQSVVTLPKTFDRKGIHKGFFKELSDYIKQDNIAILGGNDNTDEQHPLAGASAYTGPVDTTSTFTARKDGDYWTLFNYVSGNKIRLSFTNSPPPVKADRPELVDLKITDFCSKAAMPIQALDWSGKPKVKDGQPVYVYNKDGTIKMGIGGGGECAYCYQGSSPQGSHASMSTISGILYTMSQNEVQECAFGGGEPTQHPDFPKIIEAAAHYKIVPNFTTKSLLWLNEPWAKQVLDNIGGFAYSVTNHKQIDKVVKAVKALGYGKQLYVHYVLGTTTLLEFSKILEAASKHYVQVTLLGYKTNGRGAEFEQHDHEGWLDVIKEFKAEGKYIRIGVDTAIIQQFERTIKLAGISDCLYHKEEGKFSCYIDAVTNQMAPSSYCSRTEFTSYKSDTFLSTFQSY